MDELTLLRNARSDIEAPTQRALGAGRAALLERAAAEGSPERAVTPRRWAPRARWAFAATGGSLVLAVVVGNVAVNAQAAQAASFLRAAAVETIRFADPVPGSGQYLAVRTHANWPVWTSPDEYTMNEQTIDVYVPADPGAEWVLHRDWGDMEGVTGQGSVETIRAVNGEFYGSGSTWLAQDLADIPTGSGAEVLAYFDEQYVGGSASREEDNFVRIVDVLRSGLVPAKTRASMFEALALIPGVTSTDGVANLDGKEGVAIGRTEMLRGGLRQEIIIDPATGLVIGERQITTFAVFGFGFNDVVSLTAIETTITETAP